MQCPRCSARTKQYKIGFNRSGSRKYRCGVCERTYTPEPNKRGYPEALRLQAIKLYLEGNSLRSIGRILKVTHQSVSNWVEAYSKQLPKPDLSEKPQVAELDELYTFIGNKKTSSTS